MPVTEVTKDTEALSLTFVAEFPVSPERTWQLWSDPRQLERWWGPPTWPATFTQHELTAGGTSKYVMTGPDGEKAGGWWEITTVDETVSFTFVDGFANEDGSKNTEMPTTDCTVTLTQIEGGTRMTTASTFGSLEQLEELVAMGMEEGMRQAMGQIDAILAE